MKNIPFLNFKFDLMNHKSLVETMGDVVLVWVNYMVKYTHICIIWICVCICIVICIMISQRSCEIISEYYFCVCHKNRRKYNQHFKLLFSELNSQAKYLRVGNFLICPNRNDSQTFKSSSYKKISFSMYIIDATCFYECFSFHVITGKRFL